MKITPTLLLPFAIAVAGGFAAPALAQQIASEKQLREVQQQIASLGADIRERNRERDTLSATLTDIERRLAAAHSRQREIDREQREAQQKLAEADAGIKRQQALLVDEQDALERQLHAAYTSGRQERLKLILNQQEPEQLGRMLVYYRYLNDHRIANMSAMRDTLEKLNALRAAAEQQRSKLTALATEAEALIVRLTEQRGERAEVLEAIERQLQDQNAVLAELNVRESELTRLLSELSSILDDYPTGAQESLSKLRGQLTWPVPGEIRSRFGASRAGGKIRSKGVVLAAQAGTEVRAIYHGRVAFADWLPGMGLLMVIDHGDGLMSLYGYNETLQKAVGDWIAPGEVIATVGNSGGQVQPALYFELREGTRAINPSPWFRKSPGAGRR